MKEIGPEFLEAFRTICAAQQDALFKEQQQADPDALFRRAIEDLCRLAQERGVKPVLLYLPSLEEANATNLHDYIKSKGFSIIDLTTLEQLCDA